MTAGRVSLIATLLNEYGSLPAWLQALASQKRLPDELIVLDGGSTDGTLEYLESTSLPFAASILAAPGCNISEGRNLAIANATGGIIVVTDAGTIADQDWLDRLIAPLEKDPMVDLVAGFFVPQTEGLWTEALAAATLPDAGEIDPESFLPSSRSVAFRRRWFDGGFSYPEWLDYCEDLVFDLQLRRAGVRQHTETNAIVRFEPRSAPTRFFQQYFRYASGDGKAGLFFHRHAIRYATYIGAGAIIVRRRPHELTFAAAACIFHLRRAVRRAWRRHTEESSPRSLLLIVALAATQIAIGDVAKMAGYPVGLLWRIRRDRSIKFWKSGWRYRPPSGRLRQI